MTFVTTVRQETHLVAVHRAGEQSAAELADLLDEDLPFDIDHQAAHLFKSGSTIRVRTAVRRGGRSQRGAVQSRMSYSS